MTALRDHPLYVADERLAFLDSAGIRVLIVSRSRAQQHGAQIAVAGAQGHPRRVLVITGLLDVFGVPADAHGA